MQTARAGGRPPQPIDNMNHGDHADSTQSTTFDSIDCSTTHTVEPQRFADAYVRGGAMRFIAHPIGEWIEADADSLMEVRR